MKRSVLLLTAVAVLVYAGVALADEAKTATKPASGEVIQGSLVSITPDPADATKATLVVGKEKQSKVNVDSTTKIRKDEAAAKLSDLKVGDLLRVTPGVSVAKMVVDTSKTGAAGNVESGKKPEKPQASDTLHGALVSITVDSTDATKATLVVDKKKQISVTTDSTTKITKDGSTVKPSDLKAGDMLTVTPASGLAKTIEAKAARSKTPAATPKTTN